VRIAVTGAGGLVGGFVVDHFRARGDTVRALSRRPGAAADDGVERIVGALPDAAAIAALLDGADAVVHCAFDHVPGRYRGGEGDDPEGFLARNLAATRALLEGAAAHGVPRMVLLSSRAVLGAAPRSGPVGDDAEPAPDTTYGRLKHAEERLAAAHADPARAPVACALRATGVYGLVDPVERSKWHDLAVAVRDGAPAPEPRRGTEVHGADLADAIARLVDAPAAAVAGRVFNCSDLAVDRRDLVLGLAERLGVPARAPAAAPPVVNALDCPGLRALGWRPGGEARLAETLDRLAAAVSPAR
jgi:nucleoside-diphosphate-sugar epimerase